MTAQATSIATGPVKPLLGGVLAFVAVGAVAFGLMREARNSEVARTLPAPSSSPATAVGPPETTVYYFHGDTRCETCLAIEHQTNDLLQRAFADELAAGRARFMVVNFDTPENRHFRDDYNLSFGSVIVAGDGGWENLGDVWKLVHDDRAAFDRYLTERIRPYMESAP